MKITIVKLNIFNNFRGESSIKQTNNKATIWTQSRKSSNYEKTA